MSLGAQSGFSKRISELQDRVLVREKELDDIYDFSLLMKLDSGVSNDRYQLPPVLRIAESRFTKSSDDFITTSGVTYEIVRPAKLVSSPPNWRQFLIFKPNSEVRMPHQVLMPKNDEERELWAGWIQDGWVKGMEQADFEMTARISELGEVFVGMVKYARLVKQGVIRPAVVTESNQSIVGGGSQMVLDQTQIRISAPATMNTNTREWEAVVVDPRESLRYPIEKKNNNKVDKADVNE